MRQAPHILLLAVLALALPAFAQDADRHLADATMAPLCSRSAFVHGYIHGYEDGFHEGNIDLHMGHRARPFNSIKPYRQAAGYREHFGDRGFYHAGYQQGFRVAYSDAFNDGVFRGLRQLQDTGEKLSSLPDNKNAAHDFDRALAAGYTAGQAQGQSAIRPPADLAYLTEQCRPQRSPAYCDAYTRGFRLGFADSWSRHRNKVPELQTAKK